MTKREQKAKAICKEIQDKMNELKKLNYTVSDVASSICVIDDIKWKKHREGKLMHYETLFHSFN